jgi:cardiolipin synthase A/B
MQPTAMFPTNASPIGGESLWTTVLPALGVLLALLASAHVILHKRETRAAIGWIGLIWLSPFVGAALYALLGINRITRKARSLRRDQPRSVPLPVSPCAVELLHATLGPEGQHLAPLAELVGRTTGLPLLPGNTVELLVGGAEAYPAMLEAIRGAERSITLATYIFNDDPTGRAFVAALGDAVRRGVEVRVLVDDIGSRYDLPRIFGPLRRATVPCAAFLPTLVPTFFPYFNMRNHRKILVVDGTLGFTGGMNIDNEYSPDVADRACHKTDLHFRLTGPIVGDLQRTFADDWVFATDELLQGEPFFTPQPPDGPVLARGVAAGPDQVEDRLRVTILGALACARESVAIMTPYFVPDEAVLSALDVAALRGVRVDLLLPRANNLTLVHWASLHLLDRVLAGGTHVWQDPPPFSHAKLVIVDGVWTFLGSANWDARSLRLNFEFNVECYDPALAGQLNRFFEKRLHDAEPLTLEALRARGLPLRLRDGVAALLSPYL